MHAPRQLTSRRFQVWQEWLLGHQVSSCLCMCQQPSIKARGMCDCTKWSFSPQSQDKELGQNSALFLCRTAFFLHSSERYLQTRDFKINEQKSHTFIISFGVADVFCQCWSMGRNCFFQRRFGTQRGSVTSHSLLLHSWVAVVLKCFRFVIIPLRNPSGKKFHKLTCHNGGTQWAL